MTRDELIRAVVTEIDRQSPNLISASMSIIDLVLEEAAKVAETLFFETGLPGIEREAGGSEVSKAIRALKGNHHE